MDTNTPSPAELPKLIDIAQLASALSVQPRHVRRLVYERRVPFIKWGHLIRFDLEDIRSWLDESRRVPKAPFSNDDDAPASVPSPSRRRPAEKAAPPEPFPGQLRLDQ